MPSHAKESTHTHTQVHIYSHPDVPFDASLIFDSIKNVRIHSLHSHFHLLLLFTMQFFTCTFHICFLSASLERVYITYYLSGSSGKNYSRKQWAAKRKLIAHWFGYCCSRRFDATGLHILMNAREWFYFSFASSFSPKKEMKQKEKIREKI